MFRSIGAVAGGFLFIAAFASGANLAMHSLMPQAWDASGRVDNPAVLLLTLGYAGIFAITGCYLAARVAPARPMLHALILGALGLVFNISGAVATWNTAPPWYHIAALALVLPYAWLGGRLRVLEFERAATQGSPALGM